MEKDKKPDQAAQNQVNISGTGNSVGSIHQSIGMDIASPKAKVWMGTAKVLEEKTRNQVQELLSVNKIEEALMLLKQVGENYEGLTELIIIQYRRYSDLKEQEFLGKISAEDISIEKTKITEALLSYLKVF